MNGNYGSLPSIDRGLLSIMSIPIFMRDLPDIAFEKGVIA